MPNILYKNTFNNYNIQEQQSITREEAPKNEQATSQQIQKCDNEKNTGK